MSKLLGKYVDDYEDLVREDKKDTNMSKIYSAFNKKTKTKCCLKIISKEKLKTQDYNYLLERLEKEQEIQTECNSENTVNFYRRFETEENIIFELEYCEDNLNNLLIEKGDYADGCREKKLFKHIVISLAKALKTLHEKGIIHRDIKPSNIYIKDEVDWTIKLGDFGCAIKIKENKSDSIGTLLYNAPEIIKDLEYDEKVDLWSLGITLFELYFGVVPYGYEADEHAILNAIYDEDNFVLKKTFDFDFDKPGIVTVDILFKRLLAINPENRMTFEEFFDYIFSYDFMEEGVIAVDDNPKYQEIYNNILKEEYIDYYEERDLTPESEEKTEKKNIKIINSLVSGVKFPDIMSFSNGTANADNKFNNIIYYDTNVNYRDADYFERITPGAFILCTNMDSFKLIREEILIEIEKDKRLTFNLITTGSQCDNLMKFLDEDIKFKNIIKNVCIYCANIKKWEPLKKKYSLIYDVVRTQKAVKEFIQKFSSKEIKAYHITKLITLKDYLDKYKDRHFTISQYYGDLTPETYKKNIEKINSIIAQEGEKKQLFNKDKNEILQGFLTFDLTKDLQILDKFIIKDYRKSTFYGDLNKWIMNTNFNSYEAVAYYTARLMYSLNKFADKKGNYYVLDKTDLYRGMKLTYSNILPYERAKGKVILLSAFTSTSEEKKVAEKFSGRKYTQSLYNLKKRFSVILFIKNFYKQNWIANSIKIETLSKNKSKKEILYQPFSFYFVRDVQIDHKNYKADIYLETIGKQEILEEQIKIGKEIEYIEKEKIMKVK